ncbi:MAG: leucine--tRNA ligase [Ignavibacteriales bacterium]|nr:leucine--tRNA ligase [Ignavibacteriales bacterium]
MRYDFATVEPKWRDYWAKKKVYETDLRQTENRHYVLVMFSYPSGAKLHCGHWYNYGPADTFARYKSLTGANVFEPMGFDAFGLPAENNAIKTGVHPRENTLANMKDIREQLREMGCMYDWNAELATCEPEYYKWNQWLFQQLFKKGLAYRKNAPVNWCGSCNTVLANEQVLDDGSCERCGETVEQKALTQWFFKITHYAEELLAGLETIDWPERTKTMQRNWIGKSVGAEIEFDVVGSDEKIRVFTTRPDTLFGVTYVVLAPEHPLVDELTTDDRREAVERYREQTRRLTEIERTSTTKEKTGAPIGAEAINPVNGERVPIWIADYALLTYGTGCVMAVPAHDERDFEFAKKFDLEIRKVILQPKTDAEDELEAAYVDPGTMVNSGEFDGIPNDEGKLKIVEWLEKKGKAEKKINYRLRDWLLSRQRYWGTPIPVVHCPTCGEVLVPEKELPVELPSDVEFKPSGESPLARAEEFMNVACPKCGGAARRDPDTMDTFVDSSWYYLRYLDPRNPDAPFDKKLADAWTPVDTYVGGAEHAVMHLLYSRFVHKFLRDLGWVSSDEPFARLVHQGTITNQGAKMSKSKGNVVNPNEFIDKVGSDVFRMYLMFMGPYEDGGDWSDKGITGVERFAQRAYDLFTKHKGVAAAAPAKERYDVADLSDAETSAYRKVNRTIVKVADDLEKFRFNTAIAALMELQNELAKTLDDARDEIKTSALERFAVILAPFAPHLAEECWETLGKTPSLFEKPVWFPPNEDAAAEDAFELPVQINGKLRASLPAPIGIPKEKALEMAKNDERVMKFLEGKTIVKEIYVPNKIVNLVVK